MVSPKTLGGELIPSGAVRRVLLYDHKLRHGRGARRPDKENHYFAAFAAYVEFTHDAVRFVLWYGSHRSSIGRPIRHIPRGDSSGRRRATYPLKRTPPLVVKAIDVIRRMLLLQNASFYMSRVLVASRVYFGHRMGDVDAQPPRAELSNITPPQPHKASPGGRSCSSSGPPVAPNSGGTVSTLQSLGASGDLSDAATFDFIVGSASAEAFFSDVWA